MQKPPPHPQGGGQKRQPRAGETLREGAARAAIFGAGGFLQAPAARLCVSQGEPLV